MKTETMIFLCGLAVAFASCFFVLIATGAMHKSAPGPCFRIDCRTVAHSHEPEDDCPGVIEDMKNRHTAKVPPPKPEIVPPGTVPKYERTGWTCSTCGATFHTWQAVEDHLPCTREKEAKSDE